MLSKYRPNCPIIGLTTDETTCHQMNMSWGILPGVIEEQTNTDELINQAIAYSLQKDILSMEILL